MSFEKQITDTLEVARRYSLATKVVAALGFVELVTMSSAGLLGHDRQPAHKQSAACIDCEPTALDALDLRPFDTLPLKTFKPLESAKRLHEAQPIPTLPKSIPSPSPAPNVESPTKKTIVPPPPARIHERYALRPAIRFRGGFQERQEVVDGGFPQCDKNDETKLQKDRPTASSLGKVILGINHGYPLSVNKCLPDMLEWAAAAGTREVYLNASNPGVTEPKKHGWQIAKDAIATLMAASPSGTKPTDYGTGWVDVETVNTWQYGSEEALLENRKVVEGEVAYLEHIGMKVGIYSANSVVDGISPFTGKPGYSMFHHIVGKVPNKSNLNGLPNWLATGDNSLQLAKKACDYDPLTPSSEVVLTQYGKNGWDYNLPCSEE